MGEGCQRALCVAGALWEDRVGPGV